MPLPSGDQDLLEGPNHTLSPGFVIWPRTEIASATLVVPAGGLDYPVAELTVTGTSANWLDALPGMRYEITDPTGTLITSGILRKANVAASVYIDAKSEGDPGLSTRVHDFIENGDTITIYNDFPLWTTLSVIRNGKFYKAWDFPYVDQGSQPSPIVNMGDWGLAILEPGETTGSFDYTAVGHAWGTATISSYSWTLPTGATLTGGALNTDTVSFTMPPGFGLLQCTVTDSNSKTRTGIRPIWCKNRTGSTDLAYSRQNAFSIESDTQDLKGRTLSILVTHESDMPESTVYPGCPLLFFDGAKYNGSSLSTGVGVDRAVGFIWATENHIQTEVTPLLLDVQSVWTVLNTMPMVNQAIIETATPANWTEVADGLADPNFLIWYVLEHHCPNVLTLFDYNYLSTTPPRKRLYALNGNSVAAQLEEIAALLGANIGVSSAGNLYLLRNPVLEDNTFRNAMDVRWTLQEQHLVGDVVYPHRYRMDTGQLTNYAFALDAAGEPVALRALAPGLAQGQGINRTEGDSWLVVDQDELNIKTGHRWAEMNAPIPEITATLNRNLDIFDPARLFNVWWRILLPASKNPRGTAIDWRTIVQSVSREWTISDGGTVLKNISITLKPETFGQPADTLEVEYNRADGENRNGGSGSMSRTPPERFIDQAGLRQFAVLAESGGSIGRTWGAKSASALWISIKGNLTGVVNDGAFDPSSPFIQSGYVDGGLGMWCVTTSSTTLRIYYSSDVLANQVTWEQQASYTMADSTCTSSARLVHSDQYFNTLAVAWRGQTGTYVVWTSDGTNWSASGTKVDSASSSDTANDNAPLGLALTGVTTYCTGRKSTDNKYRLYYASALDTSFSEVTSSPTSDGPVCPIYIYGGEVYASFSEAVTSVYYVPDYYAGSATVGKAYTTSIIAQTTAYDTNDFNPPVGPIRGTKLSVSSGSSYSAGATVLTVRGDFGEDIQVEKIDFLPLSYFDAGTPTNHVYLGEFTIRLLDSSLTELYSGTGTATGAISSPYTQLDTLTPASIVTGVRYVEYSIQNPTITSAPSNYEIVYGFYSASVSVYTGLTGNYHRLYAVADPTGSPTWTNITPSGKAPSYADGISADPLTDGKLATYAVDVLGENNELFVSLDFGTTWGTAGAQDATKHGIIIAGSAAIYWGNGVGEYTEAGVGTAGTSFVGNWGQTIGTLGEVTFIGMLI